MAYICYRTEPCDKCEHYRFDEEINRMACWAEHDEQCRESSNEHGKQSSNIEEQFRDKEVQK